MLPQTAHETGAPPEARVIDDPATQYALAAGHHLRLIRGEEALAAQESREPDGELVAAAHEQALAAFERVVSETQPTIRSLAQRLLPQYPGHTNDVIQDVYRRAFSALHDFQGSGKVSTWLHRITVNTAHNARARLKLQNQRNIPYDHASIFASTDGLRHSTDNYDTPVLASSEPDPLDKIEQEELRQRVREGLQTLKPALREAVVLFYIYDSPVSEIAQQLGISETAVKVRLHRGRKQLKVVLSDIITPSTEDNAA